MSIAYLWLLIVYLVPVVVVIIVLAALWRTMKAFESIAESLRMLVHNQKSISISQ